MKMLARQAMVVLLLALCAQSAFAQRKTTYYHNDALGSVVAASDESGQLLWRKEYAPFGQQLDSTAENEKLSYTGKEHDDLTGLTYFGARYYDPYLGRFMGIDPAGVDPENLFTFNRYSYGNNNPYRFVDPDGWQSADTSCEEVCQEEQARAARAAPFRQVAQGAGNIADAVDQEASSASSWVPFGAVVTKAGRLFTRGAKAARAGTKIPVPALKSSPFGGKIADAIPTNGVPANWSREQIGDAIVDYNTSIVSRKAELAAFDALGGGSATQRLAHARRITLEENFVKSLAKAHER